MKRILLIGSTGFVGKVFKEILQQNGDQVIVSNLRLDQSTDWSREVEQVDAIVNAGGVAHVPRIEVESKKQQMDQANCLGLLPLVEAFNANPQSRVFVNLSSVAASGWSVSSKPVNESQDIEPTNWYGQTKLAGEQLLNAHSKNESDKLIVNLRPPLIIGANARGNFEKLNRLASRNKWLPFGAVNNRRSLLSVRNLADAVVHLIEQEDKFSSANSGNYFICDQHPVSLKQMVEALGHKRQLKQVKVPPHLLRLALIPLVGRESADSLLADLIFDASKFARNFGWEPRYDTIQELRKLAR